MSSVDYSVVVSERFRQVETNVLNIQEQWTPPCESIVKINFDGAFDVYQARSGFGSG